MYFAASASMIDSFEMVLRLKICASGGKPTGNQRLFIP
jgi:hypothetical protein